MLDTQDNDREIADEESVSIRDSLEAALTEQASESEQGAAPAPEGSGDGDGESSAPATASDRPRDEHGKFTKKEQQPEAEAKPQEGADPGEESGEADKPANDVPSSWNAKGRELFTKADPELQEYIRTREGQMQEGVAKLKTEYEGKARFAEDMWREIAPHNHLIEREGGNPVAAVRDLLGMAALMRTGTEEQKRKLLLDTAQQFGVNLHPDAQGVAQPAQQFSDPRVDELQGTLKQMMTQQEQRERAQLQSDVEQFAQDKPHFEKVRGEMGRLIQSGLANDLNDAYERAIWLVPEVREQVQAELAEKTAKDKEAKSREQAEKARKASGSVTGAPGLAGNGQAVTPAPTVRAELERAMAAQRA